MTIQEAYNQGLDDAENSVVVKFSNALIGNDDGPFNNPQIEDIRQKILSLKQEVVIFDKDYDYILDYLLTKTVDENKLSSIDKSIISILKFCEEIVGPKPRSRVSVKAKQFLTTLKIDLLNNRDKLN